ncbi:hypothetical protein ABKV19_023017 [Rosa sericea]
MGQGRGPEPRALVLADNQPDGKTDLVKLRRFAGLKDTHFFTSVVNNFLTFDTSNIKSQTSWFSLPPMIFFSISKPRRNTLKIDDNMAFLDYRNNTRVQKDDLLNFSCQIRRTPIEELYLQSMIGHCSGPFGGFGS